MTLTPSHMKDHILARIREGSVHARSKYYFYAKVALVVCVALLALIISMFIFNFILFSIFAEHRAPLLHYGPSGYWLFIQLFPWPLFVIDLALLFILQHLMRMFEFVYRKPVVYLLVLTLLGSGVCGFFLFAHTNINARIEQEAHHGHLPPPVRDFFDDAHLPPPPR